MLRWGNPDAGKHGHANFGVVLEDERRFDGFTNPSRIRAGWFFGTQRFDSGREFFRAVV